MQPTTPTHLPAALPGFNSLPPPPPGYSREEAARHPYPLLLLNDGQNLFDDRLSYSGFSWRAGEAAAQLIASGQVPPFLLAGIDHAGAQRSLEYLPYKPGSGPGGGRGLWWGVKGLGACGWACCRCVRRRCVVGAVASVRYITH